MIVFIDESGDPGFKVSKGSSPYFVIALIIFDEELDAEETAVNIKKLIRSLKKSAKFEFKFNKCSKELRIEFLKTISKSPFSIRAIVFNKTAIYSSFLRENKKSFYNFALKTVLDHSQFRIRDAKIRIDGSGEKMFRQELTTYLRRSLNSQNKQLLKNVRFRDSQKDVLIQLADMVAGSIRRYYEQTSQDWQIYREILKKKEENIWEFK